MSLSCKVSKPCRYYKFIKIIIWALLYFAKKKKLRRVGLSAISFLLVLDIKLQKGNFTRTDVKKDVATIPNAPIVKSQQPTTNKSSTS